jgi:hypothetical protein
LTFNFRTGVRTREKIRGFADVIVQDVAINAADKMWDNVKARIAQRLNADVFAEISKMARLYKQYTIGLSGDRTGQYGTLTPASTFAPGFSKDATYRLRTSWAPRKRSYLARKVREVGHRRWFDHKGRLSKNMGRGAFWTDVFGPIRIDVHRHENMSLKDAMRTAGSQKSAAERLMHLNRLDVGGPSNTGGVLRVHVASIRVSAMERITPAMLPALRAGDIDAMAPDGRKTGLIGLFPNRIARNLAGSSQAKNFVPYRHTIEPFLGFVLTRAIPNAVMRRIEEGLGAHIRFDKATASDRKFVNPL